MKQQFIRNLKFWFIQVQKIIAIMAAFAFVYTLILTYTEMNYMIMIALVFAATMPMSYIGSYIPMLIGFGSKRSEAVWGFQIMNVLSVIEILIVTFIHNLVFSEKWSLSTMEFVYLAIGIVICLSVSQMIGVFSLKYGKVGIIVGACALGLLIATTGIAAVFAMNNFIELITVWYTPVIIAGVAVVVYIISLIVFTANVKRFEVQHG